MKHDASPRAHIRSLRVGARQPHAGTAGERSEQDHESLHELLQKLTALLSEVAIQTGRKRAIRLPGMKELTGDSRSQVYARMNRKCSAYDPSFPLPFYVGKSPRWWEHDVIAWLERQASISTRH